MSNVLRMDKQKQIQSLINLGWSDRRISRETGIHRFTISKYRQQFQNRPKVPPDFFGEKGQLVQDPIQNVPKVLTDPSALPATSSQQLQPYLQQIKEKAEFGFSSQRIYQDLVDEEAYSGSYDSIRRYVNKLKRVLPKHFDRLPTYPGHEAQVDFGKGALVFKDGKYRWAWFFKMTLSFSGHAYEELVFGQDLETFIRCHEHAFHSFCGIPERVRLDNLKSGVLKACLFEPILNQVYAAFSDYCGFVPDPCIPRKPEHKGRVEKDIDYTKSNALKGRKFASLDEGNGFLRHWNKRWARTRIHGTKKRQVWQLFNDHERSAFKQLPEKPFPYFKISERKVDVTGHIEVMSNFYSVPHYYIGQKLMVHFNQLFIKVFHNNELLVCHSPKRGKGCCTTIPGHKPPYKPISLEMAEGWQCKKAKAVGPNCHRLVYNILSKENDPLAIRRSRGILALAKKYPADVVEQACLHALNQYSYSYGRVKQLCELFKNSEQEHKKQITQEHDLIRSTKEYQTLFDERSL